MLCCHGIPMMTCHDIVYYATINNKEEKERERRIFINNLNMKLFYGNKET